MRARGVRPDVLGMGMTQRPVNRRTVLYAVIVTLCVLAPSVASIRGTGPVVSPVTAGQSVGPQPTFRPAEVSAQLHNRVVTAQLEKSRGATSVQNPEWLAYDSADTSFYVAVSPSSVEVVPYSASGYLNVTHIIPVGSAPFGVAFDSGRGDIFVANTVSSNVSVISDATQTVVANIAVGVGPLGVAYDWVTDEIYVANNGTANVSVISGTTLSVVATVSVGMNPLGVAFDGATGRLFVADHGSSQVSVISGSDNRLLTSVNVGSDPYGVAIDPAADTVYVTNPGSSNVSVLSAASDSLVATVPVVPPFGSTAGPNNTLEGLAFDPSDGYVWVGAGSRYAILINPANQSVIEFFPNDQSGVVYDPDSGDICVTNTANDTFECFLFPSAAYLTRSVVFQETGLPPTTPWNVTLGSLGPTQRSNSSSILFGVEYGPGLPYTVLADGRIRGFPRERHSSQRGLTDYRGRVLHRRPRPVLGSVRGDGASVGYRLVRRSQRNSPPFDRRHGRLLGAERDVLVPDRGRTGLAHRGAPLPPLLGCDCGQRSLGGRAHAAVCALHVRGHLF